MTRNKNPFCEEAANFVTVSRAVSSREQMTKDFHGWDTWRCECFLCWSCSLVSARAGLRPPPVSSGPEAPRGKHTASASSHPVLVGPIGLVTWSSPAMLFLKQEQWLAGYRILLKHLWKQERPPLVLPSPCPVLPRREGLGQLWGSGKSRGTSTPGRAVRSPPGFSTPTGPF